VLQAEIDARAKLKGRRVKEAEDWLQGFRADGKKPAQEIYDVAKCQIFCRRLSGDTPTQSAALSR